jgi:hypothetical protein
MAASFLRELESYTTVRSRLIGQVGGDSFSGVKVACLGRSNFRCGVEMVLRLDPHINQETAKAIL